MYTYIHSLSLNNRKDYIVMPSSFIAKSEACMIHTLYKSPSYMAIQASFCCPPHQSSRYSSHLRVTCSCIEKKRMVTEEDYTA